MQTSPLAFFSLLRWIDGRPLLDTMEPFRRELHTRALFTFRPDGSPLYNMVLSGRGKKNNKTTDLVLACFYCFLVRTSPQGNDCFILANDEDQAGDDLSLAKKIVSVNPVLSAEVEVLQKEIRRKDGAGTMRILPARDAAGAHGKTSIFTGYDEIHSYRTWDLFEAMAPDPTRHTLQWITSYDTIYNTAGVPLHDLKKIGASGQDPRMLFSWYSGDVCTDPKFADLPPEQRANPSMSSWPDGVAYLEQQKRRLPTHKYRRLHLNLPGAPDGAFFDADAVLRAVVSGRASLPPEEGITYRAFVDMSGGSADDAVLAIAFAAPAGRCVVARVVKQPGKTPFNPRSAVKFFVDVMREYGVSSVTGDAYAGQTFRVDFDASGITYNVSKKNTTELYEALEPRLNAGEVELPDVQKLQEQLLTLVVKGAKVTHQPGDHDDFANAVAGVVEMVLGKPRYEALVIPCAPIFAPKILRDPGDSPHLWSGPDGEGAVRRYSPLIYPKEKA